MKPSFTLVRHSMAWINNHGAGHDRHKAVPADPHEAWHMRAETSLMIARGSDRCHTFAWIRRSGSVSRVIRTLDSLVVSHGPLKKPAPLTTGGTVPVPGAGAARGARRSRASA